MKFLTRILPLCCAALILTAVCADAKTKKVNNVKKYKIGSYKFIALNNNTGMIKESLIGNSNSIDLDLYRKDPRWLDNALNYFLLDTGKNKILFDSGPQKENGGMVVERLKEAGYKPQDITIVCLTHMHGDHIGGMVNAENKKVFPNAKVYVALEEATYWENKSRKKEPSFQNAQRVLRVYEDNLVKFPRNADVIPGVKTVALFGHTPGHSGFMITKGKKKVIVWGDLIHAKVQFENPEIYLTYDFDPHAATAIRKHILQEIANTKTGFAGMHVIKPGAGYVKTAERGYRFVPGI